MPVFRAEFCNPCFLRKSRKAEQRDAGVEERAVALPSARAITGGGVQIAFPPQLLLRMC